MGLLTNPQVTNGLRRARRPPKLAVPHLCRSIQSASEFTVRSIESSGVVLLEHPRSRVAKTERN